MTGAVDVGVVASLGLELNVGRRDGNTTLALLRSLVDGTVVEEAGQTLGGLVLGDGSSQGGLSRAELDAHFHQLLKSTQPTFP